LGGNLDREKKQRNLLSRIMSQICSNPLILLILITLIIITYLLTVQIRIGVPYWDVFNYLNNALYFAGIDGGGISIFLPPLIPILTSIIFRMGYISITAIFLVTGMISVIGVIGFYLLLKERFNPIQSFTGSLIFISLPVMISWVVSGGIDIPGVVFSIWTVYFMILGLKKDSKFLYFVLPLFVIAFLARYTSGLIILPMLLYILINPEELKKLENLKKIIIGILIEFGILIVGVLCFFMKLGVSASIFNLIFATITATSTGAGDVAYNPDLLYYIHNLMNYISVGPLWGSYQQTLSPSLGVPSILSYLIALISIVGLSFYVYKGVTSRFDIIDKADFIDKAYLNKSNLLKFSIIVALIIELIVGFNYKSLIVSEIIFICLLYTIHLFLFSQTTKNKLQVSMNFIFLAWFGVYLIFHGILPFKVDRYFITMTPAFVYFLLLGISEFMGLVIRIKPQFYSNFRKCGVYLIIALVLLSFSTATYVGHAPKKAFTVDIGYSSDWLKDYDPQYQDKIIRSDYPNAVSWYLRMDVTGAYPRLFNTTDQFNDYLKNNSVDYYIDSTRQPHPNLNNYRIIKTFGVVAIYQKK
jgi:hypothetical protein